jgi:class 3 adenylate cyclase/tetratricopeptide (TPR) repeat protein
LDATAGTGRRFLTLLFADLSASSLLAEQLDAEHLGEIIGTVRRLCREAVVEQGGEIVRAQGDGVLAVFGLEATSESAGRQACDAALRIHRQVAQLTPVALATGPHTLQMHSGIHAGLVLVGEGGVEQGRMELIGDAPNTAARLSSLAQAGEILADVETLGPALHFFATTQVRSIGLPGRSAPVIAARILGPSGLERRFDATAQRGLTPFIGRRPLVERTCAELLEAQAHQRPYLLAIRGEGGMGKTRFLEELSAALDAQGCVSVHGRCENYRGARVLFPLLQVLQRLRSALGPEQGGMHDPAEFEGAGAERLRERLREALLAAAALRPVVLLDDWQWADDASRQVLDALLEMGLPLQVVAAARPAVRDLGIGAAAHALDLVPFTLEETRATVARWVPGADPFVTQQIHEYTGGVPLWVEEICQTLRRRGEIGLQALRGSGGRAGTPGWMAGMVAGRLHSVDEAHRSTVRTASVLGTHFPARLLERLEADACSADRLAALHAADLIYPAESATLRFKHALTRDAVYELLPLAHRRTLHARVVEVLHGGDLDIDGGDVVEMLAHHTLAAGLWREATTRCEAAGDRALAACALDRAREHYLASIESMERSGLTDAASRERWCLLVHKLSLACMFDPLAFPGVMPMAERCHALAQELAQPSIQARSAYWLGYLSYVFGSPKRATMLCREALAIARRIGDVRLIAQIEAALGQTLAAACEYEPALVLMDAAVQAKRQGARSGGAVAVGSAFTLACRAGVLADQGDFAGAHAALADARGLLGASLHPVSNSLRNWTMVILAWQGRWDDALQVVEEAIRMAERSHALLPLAIARAVGGYAAWRRDGEPARLQETVDAVGWMERRGSVFFTSIYHGWLVEGLASVGRAEPAREHLTRVVQLARAGERLGESTAWRAMALQAVRSGDFARAQRCLAHATASAKRRRSRRDEALNRLCESSLLRALDREALAQRLADDAQAACRAMQMQW